MEYDAAFAGNLRQYSEVVADFRTAERFVMYQYVMVVMQYITIIRISHYLCYFLQHASLPLRFVMITSKDLQYSEVS